MRNGLNLITLTSDFEKQSQSIAVMHAMIYTIAPQAKIIDLMHGLPSYNLISAARTMETVSHMPVGVHICVCDPGVGSKRKAIICEVERGDYFIGPDNGVFVPATKILGGITRVYEITNSAYLNKTISPLFHGRDVFAPVAAHLINNVPIKDFGPELIQFNIEKTPYEEASINDKHIKATIIQINKFGSAHLNILHSQWDKLKFSIGSNIIIKHPNGSELIVKYAKTFSDLPIGHSMILNDDYGRIEIAINQGNFSKQYNLKIGDVLNIVFEN